MDGIADVSRSAAGDPPLRPARPGTQSRADRGRAAGSESRPEKDRVKSARGSKNKAAPERRDES